MPVKPSKSLAVIERRQQVAQLYLQGWTQQSIAKQLEVVQSTICYDLQQIRKEWRLSAIRDFDDARAMELQRIDRIAGIPARRMKPRSHTMLFHRPPRVDVTKLLTRQELATVLTDLHRQAERSFSMRLNLVLFRLAACCGLRVSEIAQLAMGDVRLDGPRSHLRIRHNAAKGGRGRMVPLWWDVGTLHGVTDWCERRRTGGATEADRFLVSLRPGRAAKTFSRHTLRRRFLTACKSLGLARLRTLTIHHGRYTFISYALVGGRTLAEVRDAAGHANVSITSAYLHIAVDDEGIGSLFASH